ncbi:MAG: SCP2 sterol-binding domain-containing protein [Pseudomonadota bacterium]
MTLEELTGFFNMIAPRASVLGAVLKFDFGEEGVVHIDATQNPALISNDNKAADTIVTASLADFSAILAKQLSGDLAFAMGKLRVSGDLITGVRITELLNR